ncbi:unnamed protein product [Fusarium graminearum]|uniref:Chromosome 4, complete genome n=2 Tax=Gibberella zeae TaxID=5518 RepID=A0A098DS59_GIBZE|nr:unnamed protein product [Fusarium graminearum]CAF3619237.1 unnamed protein product [Fusarium graminearum]CAG1961108.1 unnamed protein product [Fusarium graminearum]CAG1992371.1 unnamed protein product [Fusarium graminearum]CEF84696.1 unnamed protein product [Fusarium graminearum]
MMDTVPYFSVKCVYWCGDPAADHPHFKLEALEFQLQQAQNVCVIDLFLHANWYGTVAMDVGSGTERCE